MKKILGMIASLLGTLLVAAEKAPIDAKCICKEGDTWTRIRFNTTAVEKGSIMDFGALMNYHKPAGKYGFLKVVGDHFEFEGLPGVPQKFFGANLCEVSNILGNYAREDAAVLAEAMARAGYNSVRFHHYDDYLVDKSNGYSTDLDPEKMDRFDYLVNEFKKRGMYMTLDLYVSRKVTENELKGLWHPVYSWNYKNAVYLLASAKQNFLTFCRNLLSHRNPYTGLTYAEEPAIAFVSVLNENGMRHWNRKNNGGLGYQWEENFHKWCDANDIPKERREENPLRMKFIQEFQNEFFGWMRRELRAMGLKVPLTDENNFADSLSCLTHENYDYLDNHMYVGHPRIVDFNGSWRPPVGCDQRSWLEHVDEHLGGLKIFPMRDLNKPYTITELRWCKPMHSRGEGGLIMGAMAAFQDYSAIETFQWAWGGKEYLKEAWGGYFDIYGDPIGYVGEHIIQLLFMRGDVKPADVTVNMIMPNDASLLPADNYADDFTIDSQNGLFALVAKYGHSYYPALDHAFNYRYTSKGARDNLAQKLSGMPIGEKGLFDFKNRHFVSCTGELDMNCQAKTYRVVTPKSEGMLMINKGTVTANCLAVDNKTPYTTCFASALDDATLADSGRIIFFHLTNAVHDGMKFDDEKMGILVDYGGYGNPAPHLVLRSEADVTLQLNDNGREPAVYAINLKGQRVGQVKSTFTDGMLKFTANTSGLDGQAVIVYEIAR